MDIDHAAPAIADLSVTIDAPLETIWRLHTDIGSWPRWNPGITSARLTTELEVGGIFEWQTAGLTITSTIGEITPMGRIAWGGPAHGIIGIHVWTFEPGAGGVVVRTRESWDGEPVRADPDGMRAGLTASLVDWLDALKSAAEGGTPA
ncbi:Shy6-polyketide cyclase [Streptomyces sp. SID13666]|uniref:SRPBCC family protein n=1 Tax=Streptomyces TaxID=1883 RepID=UPI001105C002|nr:MULTISPECIES: SRPBCC family protein [Streptomyces]MCZ4100538.1 SRPBCC family protein [Streptomyces sp. H39-C1]NEA60646.1 Shy6-polyketide cyclase [Streptomyces sp. SID13666]NEA77064.1 Shy6-polyketide cyclase [Streptomyces sp. SID13588]QNA72327.1 Shy6-polyketide cyclase [Streptomyces sp. So13.3]